MQTNIASILSKRYFIIGIFFLISVIASVQSLLLSPKAFEDGGQLYTHYNNYLIFKQSFYHLTHQQDLYALYPDEHWDLYKYTPTFAGMFGIFAIFPDWLGLTLWNLLNAFVFLASVYYLPKLSNTQKGMVLMFSLIELLTSIQNSQSNALIAGLIIFALGLLERDKYFLAIFCLMFSVYIKFFGIVGFALFLFYPHKLRFIIYSVVWAIILFLVPFLFIDVAQYRFLIASYGNLLANDHTLSYGYSVMGWLYAWFGLEINKLFVVIVGVLLFLAPLIRLKSYSNDTFRYLVLCSILIWVVIFNHKAESPTFILAMAGAALWFVVSKPTSLNLALFIIAFIFTSLSPTDIFPSFLRDYLVKPYELKVFPCILIWVKIIYELATIQQDRLTEIIKARE